MRSAVSMLAIVAGCAFAATAQTELYRQDPLNTCGGPSSQDARNPGGLGWFAETADDFPAQSDWTITSVEFWGGYCSDVSMPGNTEGFTIRFYTDNGNIPGTRIYEEDVFTFSETQYASLGNLAGYHYELDLPVPFQPGIDGDLWMSVVAILPRGGTANEPQWGWAATFVQYHDIAAQWFFNPGNFAPDANNTQVSFVLLGTVGGTTCPADLSGSSDPNDPAYGVPDGMADSADFFYYLDQFVANNVAVADLSGSSDPNDPAYGVPDGSVDASDFFYYLDLFVQGCP